MIRLIDANALAEKTLESLDDNPHTEPRDRSMHKHEHNHFLAMIDNAPTIAAEPVRHGAWLDKPIAGYSTVRCSRCSQVFPHNSGKWYYCPWCGAKMAGGGE